MRRNGDEAESPCHVILAVFFPGKPERRAATGGGREIRRIARKNSGI
jgi:hypothetical protein